MVTMNTSDNKWSWLQASNPLIISSSGGGGHISAAQSLIEQYQQHAKILAYHTAQKPSQKSFSSESILEYLMLLPHLPGIRDLIKQGFKIELPTLAALKQEYAQLIYQQAKNPYRLYIDFLLDWMPNGYLMTALFNLMQRQNHGLSLQALVKNQGMVDQFYKKTIYQQLKQVLLQAGQNGHPYDAIISTQALGIPAICQAVMHYNLQIARQHLDYPPIEIHQFITDIPHQFAKHYLSPLQHLQFLEKSFFNIHLLNIHDEVSFIQHKHAKKVWRYEINENPMIRPSLHQAPPKLPYGIKIVHAAKEQITILPKNRLAVVMLSSASGQISLDYLLSLINLKIEHIALVGRVPPSLAKKISDLAQEHSKIYILGQLNAASLGEEL
jgi:hypothetical protein